ncbi:helix-turn-helix domain-containing protein [Streptomyces sp. NPDC014735]|uniref:helix-turn-helix domain-containing protein n=1 Tax=unclassified Streptomyces TaxID=2593676 RepID=UPI0036F60E4D
MATVHRWTGLEARALRSALRMSVRAFAEHLGVAVNTVSKWEKLLGSTQPKPDTQAILDTALARADAPAHHRFEILLSEVGSSVRAAAHHTADEPETWEHESWADDLDRAVAAAARQNFACAERLLTRRIRRVTSTQLDDRELYLFARSTSLLGDLKRDQGALSGPSSAQHSYVTSRAVFAQLGVPRRVAQIDLSLAVLMEMTGRLEAAALQYEALAVDDRLSRRDRARARLWVGTTLSKDGNHDYATRVMWAATYEFEALDEPEDWSLAHQKLALARRGAGDLGTAQQLIGTARASGTTESPMQRVRLDTAHGHILLSDTATRDDGLRVLDQARRTAARYGLVHQLRSIDEIKAAGSGPIGLLRK